MTPEEFQQAPNAAIESESLVALESLQTQFADGGSTNRPYQPAIRFSGDQTPEDLEAHISIPLANALSRAERKIKYHLKHATNRCQYPR